MGLIRTVVFTDLFGSIGAFEALGNAKATQVVTEVTSWISTVIEAHGGRVVKILGDGVLALFENNHQGISAVIEIQRSRLKQLAHPSGASRMPIRIGVATGEVELVDGDCYGDAVNVAARLSDMSGPQQIWASSQSLQDVPQRSGVHFRTLGPISIRGRAESCTVYQIDWQEDVSTEFLTMQAELDSSFDTPDRDALGGQIELSWLTTRMTFRSYELPIHIGRVPQADFVVTDPRVSRTHARIDWRNGSFMLVDLSSYGCWVRFSGGGSDLLLRRKECVLHGRGEISLGSSFADLSAATVMFSLS
ncbi:adenylate/guanylate cyclase domain-containing protein [Rhodoferax sp. PAMC 29310]|uniref:adenylate/guanylate cyclase domain-containing protein n=1 Tax=Rhodoferax sp. PAMC 29310 TaxID=2822760 RepID=UPI001B32741E|nr:adenylate/guanylate cyclase domain-containing protein [Rhodoferax sp. PAMC 29310]